MNCLMQYLMYSVLFASIGLNAFLICVSIPNIRRELNFWKTKEDSWAKYWRAYYGPVNVSTDEQKNQREDIKNDKARE